jgi:hypothetical protein
MSKRRAMADIDMNSAYKSLIPKVENSISETVYNQSSQKENQFPSKISLPLKISISPISSASNFYRTPIHKEQSPLKAWDKKENSSLSLLYEMPSSTPVGQAHRRGKSDHQIFGFEHPTVSSQLPSDSKVELQKPEGRRATLGGRSYGSRHFNTKEQTTNFEFGELFGQNKEFEMILNLRDWSTGVKSTKGSKIAKEDRIKINY